MPDPTRLTALLVGAVMTLAACGGSGGDATGDATAPEGSESAKVSGRRVPDLEVAAFTGDTVSLAAYAGTPLVVNFWASWCPPCIAEMPDLESVSELAGGRVTFVGVNTQDTPDKAAEMVEQTGVSYDLVRDPDAELFQAFEVFGMPSTFYVDANGVIVGRHTGLLTRKALLEDLNDHLGVDLRSEG